jgi:L,D-peptidoglycan transpeptidase YkuD (ErfK/YbiS/YcfS/YnhG family)
VDVVDAGAFATGDGRDSGRDEPAQPARTTVATSKATSRTHPSLGALPAMAVALTVALTAACAGTGSAPAPSGAAVSPAGSAPRVVALRASSPVDHLRGVGSAQQLVVVQASRYGTSYASVTAYAHTSRGWVATYGPWTGRIGRRGFARPGAKREGDGRTPTGSYAFGAFFFGVAARPSGLHYTWRHAFTYDVWDDDSSSSRYNLWSDLRRDDAGRSPEPLHVSPAYRYAAVIAYNTSRRPHLGSAIFLHVSHGSATSGCVSLPESRLLRILRWLDPHRSPRIVMGTTAAITR